MDKELFTPPEEELLQPSDVLGQNAGVFYDEQGGAPELPKDLEEAIENQRESVRQLLLEAFGVPEVPPELAEEMKSILDEIKEQVRKKEYVAEPAEELTDRLRPLVIRMSQYKEEVTEISVEAIPEKGYRVCYTTRTGKRIEREFSEDEQDMLFNLELWAEEVNSLENVKKFREALAHAKIMTTDHPESGELAVMAGELAKKYAQFGFSREELEKLAVLEGPAPLEELRPLSKSTGLRKSEVMRQVWQEYLTRGERSDYVKLAAGLMIVGAAEGASPVLFKFMLDADSLSTAALFTSAYFGGRSALGWVQRLLTVKFEGFINEISARPGGLNERLAQDLSFQPGEQMAETGERGKLAAALRRSQEAFRSILTGIAKTTAPAIAGVVAGAGSLMMLDLKLGALALASGPIAIAIARRAEKRSNKLIGETYENEEKLALEIEQQINAHMETVLSGMRENMALRLEHILARENQLRKERADVRADMEFRLESVLGSGVLTAIIAAGMALRGHGVPEAGKIIAAVAAAGQFGRSFNDIVKENAYLLENIAAIAKMEEVFNGYATAERLADEDRRPASELPHFGLKLEKVNLEFDGKKIIDGVSFEVPAGGVVRLDGLSGQGKTTLTKLMAGYYRPTSGEISIGDHPVEDIKKTGPDSLYAQVGYLSQHSYIFDSGDLQENLEFGNPELDEEKARQVLTELGLAERFTKTGTIDLKSSVVGLSGGERTRLGLARILLKLRSQENGSLVFLDEPTEGLDEQTEAEVARILVREKAKHPNTTMVVVSHRQSFISSLEEPVDGAEGLSIQQVRIEKGKVVS